MENRMLILTYIVLVLVLIAYAFVVMHGGVVTVHFVPLHPVPSPHPVSPHR